MRFGNSRVSCCKYNFLDFPSTDKSVGRQVRATPENVTISDYGALYFRDPHIYSVKLSNVATWVYRKYRLVLATE